LFMQIRSLGSVKIISLDVNRIRERLTACAQELKQKDECVLHVYLFGSLAKGTIVPGGDADILIVLEDSAKTIIDRTPDYMGSFSGVGVPVDIFPYTRDEIEKFSEEQNTLIKEILSSRLKLA
jgi:predicted nucleotidyltransferase